MWYLGENTKALFGADPGEIMSQAEALWESKSQIAALACQDTRYKGPVYQTARLNNNNNQSTHNFYN